MYVHKVQYYETDKMGISHHSNYIRWMEEARVDFLAEIGWSYDKLEELGIHSPVISVNCQYKHPTTFPDRIYIEVAIVSFRGAKLNIAYHMRNQDGEVVCSGHSEHGFLNDRGRPVNLKREHPDFYQVLLALQK